MLKYISVMQMKNPEVEYVILVEVMGSEQAVLQFTIWLHSGFFCFVGINILDKKAMKELYERR